MQTKTSLITFWFLLTFIYPLPQILRPSEGPEPGADEASKEEDFVHKRLINHVNLIEKHTKKTLQLLIIRHRSNRTREQTQPRKQGNVKASGIQFYYGLKLIIDCRKVLLIIRFVFL